MSNTEPTPETEAPHRRARHANTESSAETAVATVEEQAVEEVGVQPLVTIGTSPITDWRAWVAQQGGAQPGQTPPVLFPGIGPITDLIHGASSFPVYDDVPTYRKPADIYQGWTAQIPNTMVPGVFPPAAVLVSRANPRTGPSAGGTVTTITGIGFLGATGVNFGANAGTAFSVVDDQTIRVTTPAGTANSAVAITVLSPKGNASLPNAFSYGA